MTISALDASSAAQGAGQAARATLTSNYETFLVLLTAQLKNQDPLAPMDSTAFTQQLVQYSQVEQQIQTNDQLESLISQSRAAAAGSALGYLGRTAIIASNSAALTDAGAQWSYTLPEYADSVRIEVRNADNRTVYATNAQPGSGERTFSWNGNDQLGIAQPDGAYSLVVTAENDAGEAIAATVQVRERITGVDLAASDPQIVTAAGARPLSAIRAILDD